MISYKETKNNNKAVQAIVNNVSQQGYCHVHDVLSPREIDFYLNEINHIDSIESQREKEGKRDQDYDYKYFQFKGSHYFNLPRRYRVFDSLLGHPYIVNTLNHIFGASCILSQVELRCPEHNQDDDGAYNWHRDGRMVIDANLWIIVFWLMEDITETNGPPAIIPGTHRKDLGDQQSMENQIKLTGNAGDIIFLNANLLHRSTKNTDGASRWLFIPTYSPWFIKPSIDFTKTFTKEQFDLFSEEQKQIFGFTSIVPVDERERIYTLRPWREVVNEIPFRSEPFSN